MEVQVVATDASSATQAFLRASALNSHCARGDQPRTDIEPRNDVRPRTADYDMKPMLCDETEAQKSGASFAAASKC